MNNQNENFKMYRAKMKITPNFKDQKMYFNQ